MYFSTETVAIATSIEHFSHHHWRNTKARSSCGAVDPIAGDPLRMNLKDFEKPDFSMSITFPALKQLLDWFQTIGEANELSFAPLI